MLLSLSIRNVVLIEALDLHFREGLTVLTGETGAGKSILLDSLSLALGARADSALVRHGADKAQVTAEFDPPMDHPSRALLAEQGFEIDGEPLLLRRSLAADGRSRAHLNDQAVSVGLLRQVGDLLVEVHGQFESHGLMNPASHRSVLDAHGDLSGPLTTCAEAYRSWRIKAKARAEAEASLDKARAEEDLLRHHLEEIAALDPQPGEEERLAHQRTAMMHGEQLIEGMNAAQGCLSGERGNVEASLRQAMQNLERIAEKAEGKLTPIIEALDRAAIEVGEAASELDRVSSEIDMDPAHLEQTEERLFALRACARKHQIDADALPDLRAKLETQLGALEDGGADVVRLSKEEQAARQVYMEAARSLSSARKAAALGLDQAISAELPPLKLDRARFHTQVQDLPESAWTADGLDDVAFLVATNPGAPPGPIGKVASGGELARFMLALKVVLAHASFIPTLVFDEVDSGVGGAVADAVGERLGRLARDVQVMVVTHSPQVAARGANHLNVAKDERTPGAITTSVRPLSLDERREEVARMLSGAEISAEARAQAERLMGQA